MDKKIQARLDCFFLTMFVGLAWTCPGLARPTLTWLENLENTRNPYHIVGGLTNGSAISEDGRIVVGSTKRAIDSIYMHEKEPFIANNGVTLGLGLPSSLYFDVLNIQICGAGNTVYGQFLGGANHPFKWNMHTGYKILDYLVVACSRDGNIIAGSHYPTKGSSVWHSDREGEILLDDFIPGNYSTSAVTGMSADGRIVVGNILNEDQQVISGYLWNFDDGVEMIDLFPGEVTEIRGISGDGSTIFGTTQLRQNELYRAIGFIWKIGDEVIIRLNPNTNNEWHIPHHSSFDGKVIVGDYLASRNFMIFNEPFIWTYKDGRRLFRDFLTRDYKLSLIENRKLDGIQGVSANGRIFTGSQLDYEVYDDFQGWIVHLESEKVNLTIKAPVWPKLRQGDDIDLELSTTNISPTLANKVEIIATLPQFLQVTDIYDDEDKCQVIFHGVRCLLDELASNDNYQLTMRVKALAPGKGNLQIIASAAQLDSNNKNNRQNTEVEVAGTPSYVNILLPTPGKIESEKEPIVFQAFARGFEGSNHSQAVKWSIANRGTGELKKIEGERVAVRLDRESYMVVAEFIDQAGLSVYSERINFEVQKAHNIQIDLTKKETGLLFFKKRKSIITWSGATSNVDIYWEKNCDGGSWFSETECFSFQKTGTGASSGTMEFDYKKYDQFMVCEAGADISKPGYEDTCSKVVQQLQ